MNAEKYLLLLARCNTEREMQAATRAPAGALTVADIRKVHEGITRDLDQVDDNFSPSRGTLRLGAVDAVRLTTMVNGLQNDRRMGPMTRNRVTENCAKIIGEFSRVGVFNSFNTEVGLVVAQRYAKSCGMAVRFQNIEPDDLADAVKTARQGNPTSLNKLISDVVTHEAIHRAEVGNYERPAAGERTVVQIPADVANRLKDISFEMEPMDPKPTGPRM